MNDKPIFGVGGFPLNFFSSEYKSKRENIFKWLREKGIDAIELQATYGVKMKEEQAIRYRELSKEYGIKLTLHAPYYVSLASLRSEVVERSKLDIKKAFWLCEILDAKRIVFHPGAGYGKDEDDRKRGLERLIDALLEIEGDLNTKDIKLYPEIGGKISQIGSLDEIMTICKNVSYAYPCIDFAHLHARSNGAMENKESYIKIFKKIKKELGDEGLDNAHFHVYPVEYGDKGEKGHKAFGDKAEEVEYKPSAKDYIEAVIDMNLTPYTICEAHNSQDIGAMLMRDIYYENI